MVVALPKPFPCVDQQVGIGSKVAISRQRTRPRGVEVELLHPERAEAHRRPAESGDDGDVVNRPPRVGAPLGDKAVDTELHQFVSSYEQVKDEHDDRRNGRGQETCCEHSLANEPPEQDGGGAQGTSKGANNPLRRGGAQEHCFR